MAYRPMRLRVRKKGGRKRVPYKERTPQIEGNVKCSLICDTVKGCKGCELNPSCYARCQAPMSGKDHSIVVVRKTTPASRHRARLRYSKEREKGATWARIGASGDPSLAWDETIAVAEDMHASGLTPVVMTKVHKTPTREQLDRLAGACTNLQVSMSCEAPPAWFARRRKTLVEYRSRVSPRCGRAVARVVSIAYKPGSSRARCQEQLESWAHGRGITLIDCPLRAAPKHLGLRRGKAVGKAVYKDVDVGEYHPHLSPYSGKVLREKYDAGPRLARAYPCTTTCDEKQCTHLCATRVPLEETGPAVGKVCRVVPAPDAGKASRSDALPPTRQRR